MLPIRLRLTLSYGGLLFLALALSGTAVVTLLRQRLTARLDAALDDRLRGVETFLIHETTRATADLIPKELAEYALTQPEGQLIDVRDSHGRVLLQGDAIPSPARARHRSFALYGENYQTKAAASEEPIAESVEEIRFLLVWSSPVLLLFIGLTGYWISSRSLRPVDEMTRVARSIGALDLSSRLPVPPARDEISRLAEAWNEMLERLDESFTRMQRFTADAAHELRTPLAALRTTAQLALRRPREAQEYREALEQVVTISERMNQLAESLLAIARGEPRCPPQVFTRVELASLVRGISAEMQPLFAERNLELQVDVPAGPAYFDADADGLRRLLVVLLDNALKYTQVDGKVTVVLQESSDGYSVAVSDTGPGIPHDALSRIFDRFFRVDPSRDRQTGGHGLGLAIARQIARAHHGQLEASSVVGEGSTFRLSLPKAADGVW
jgi:two-component system heavy metal sensor histidine kinase CusS